MNLHTARPACYLAEGEPEPRAPGFADDGRWCYMSPEDAKRLTPGCRGCRRFLAERRGEGVEDEGMFVAVKTADSTAMVQVGLAPRAFDEAELRGLLTTPRVALSMIDPIIGGFIDALRENARLKRLLEAATRSCVQTAGCDE